MASNTQLILCNGDTGSHGDGTTGTVVSSATNTYVEGKLVALNGDTYNCNNPSHNSETVITQLTKTYAEGKLMVTVKATTSCGAGFDYSPSYPNASVNATKTYAE